VARLLTREIKPPTGGEDTDSAPNAIAANRAPLIENLLLDRPEKVRLRGGLIYSDAYTLPDLRPVGAWDFNGKALLGYATTANGIEPNMHPLGGNGSPNGLADSAQLLDTRDMSASGLANVTVSGNKDNVPWGKGARLGSYVYGFAYSDNVTASVANDAGFTSQLRKLLRWDGTTTAPVAYSNAPRGGQDVSVHLNRLWVLGGTNPSTPATAPIALNTLYWSDNAGPTTDVLTAWQDDVSGLVNQIIVGDQDPYDFGVALASVGQNLVILKRRSVHVLYGTSPDTFTIRRVTAEYGCIDPRTVVETDEGVFFLSANGYIFFDGSTFTNMSVDHGIGTELQEQITKFLVQFPGSSPVTLNRAVAVALPNDHILLSIVAVTGGSPRFTTDFCKILHTPSGSWTTLTSELTAFDFTPSVAFRSAGAPWLIVANTNPLAVFAGNVTAPTGETALVSLKHRDGAYDGSPAVEIEPKWRSRLEGLSSPPHKAQIHRVIFDYAARRFGDPAGNATGWQVELASNAGSSGWIITTEIQDATQSSFGDYRSRAIVDRFDELDDVQLIVTWYPGVAEGEPLQAEIYGATIEYQTSRQADDS